MKRMVRMNKLNKFTLEIILENNLYSCLISEGDSYPKFKDIILKHVYAKRIDNCTIKFSIDKKQYTLIETPRLKIKFI
jgi:hypothetical protein